SERAFAQLELRSGNTLDRNVRRFGERYLAEVAPAHLHEQASLHQFRTLNDRVEAPRTRSNSPKEMKPSAIPPLMTV
ncbi:hypothetical protein J3L24_25200, partial [Enterobacter hormaechei]|uniref:hypothetical protein n=1 Tax=Enterobacter hormaechei TaxID=158836 RepID=UPI001FAD8503